MPTATIYFADPPALGTYARELRNNLSLHGWNAKHCAVGWSDRSVKLADDSGAIEYTFETSGRITRQHLGSPCKMIELVDIDLKNYVRMHNDGLARD